MNVNNLPPAHLDTSPGNRRGERWKDIPGFEGSFQASNYGRIRSLDRIVPHKRCEMQFVKGRILKPNIKKHYNNFLDDYVVILQATLMLENVRYEYSVRRLIYAAFRKKVFRLESPKMIISVDGNGYNNHLSNLRMVNNSERMKIITQRKRAPKRGKVAPGTIIRPTFNLWKPVHRCNSNGKIIETFPCIAYAAKSGYLEKGIGEAAKGRKPFYKGFKWKYAGRRYLKDYIKEWDRLKATSS